MHISKISLILKCRSFDSKAFSYHKNLSVVDLSYNRIEYRLFKSASPFVIAPINRVIPLEKIILDGNPKLKDVCDDAVKTLYVLGATVSLRHIGFTRLCFGQWPNIIFLLLQHNDIKILEFNELPELIYLGYLKVDLRNNPITIPSYTKEQYDVIRQRYSQAKNMTILLDPMKLDCDCQHGWLARAMRSQELHLINVRCSTGEKINEVYPTRLECEKYVQGPCTIRKSWDNSENTADCEDAKLSAIPDLVNVTRANLRYNLIDTLYPDDFGDLLYVDLRNNLISNISSEAAAAMFQSERTFLLSGNPILCDCDGLPLVTALQNFSSQVEDYNNVTCGDRRLVKDIVLEDLCLDINAVPIWVTFLFVAISLVLVTAFLIYRFNQKISFFFYTKGWCLFCFDDTDVYEDLDYDAFLSFCHLDDEFITENILPQLKDYKLCIHYRDWMAGEWIPAQIAGSIARSHRTLIFLSRNFVASSWGMLEFRMAFAAISQDDSRRLVAVVLDDVVEDDQMDAELRRFLTTNTYVKWGDPWFFKKLGLILPEREIKDTGMNSSDNEMEEMRPDSNYHPIIEEVEDSESLTAIH